MVVSVTDDEKKFERDFLNNRPPLAFAKLQGMLNDVDQFEALITQLPVEIGRGSTTDNVNGKICLGDEMSVSRLHARINWNTEKGVFELECLGKNGLLAGGKNVSKDCTIVLTSKMPLKIGRSRMYFLPAIKSPCGVMSGLKLMQKAFEKSQPAGSTTGLTVDETIDAIYKCFKDIDHEVGGRDNLAKLIRSYFEHAPSGFKRMSITAAGEPRYIYIKPEKSEDEKKRSGAATSEAKKKQKTENTPKVAPTTTTTDPIPSNAEVVSLVD